MENILKRYCSALNVVLCVVLIAMTAMVFGNVVLRYVFNSGISVSEELSRWLLVWLTFVGAVIALNDGGHLGTEVVMSRLPNPLKRVAMVVGLLMMLYATWLLLAGSLTQTEINMRVMGSASGIPVGVMHAAGVFFGGSGIVILLHKLWVALTGDISSPELLMVKGSEDAEQVEELHLAAPQPD